MSGTIALVTGANGNVGSAVAARLAREGWRVRGLVRAGTSPVGETARADLIDSAALARAAQGAELVVHCAAAFSDDVDACRRSNIEGVACLVDVLVAGGCPGLVHISTISVYDDAAGPNYEEESALWSGVGEGDAYGRSKAESERIITAAATRGLGAVILRPGLITSMHPRSRWGPQAVERAAASPSSILPFPELPHVHVDNLADAVVLAARVPGARGRAYNVIDGVAPGRDYLDAVYAAAGRPAPPIPPDAPLLRFRAQRIRDELGYAPIERWQAFLAEIRSYRRR